MGRTYYFVISLTVMSVAGCATYHQQPLNHSAVTAALKPPTVEEIRIEAEEIKHPILKPLEFNPADGLSPDEAAIMAVLANPTLKAARDQKGIAAAQLLQAGILPNPELSYALDIPTGGATQGTVPGFGFGLGWDITSLITRPSAIDAAKSQASSVDLSVAWEEWQMAEAAKLHLYRLVFLNKQLAVAKNEEEGLKEQLDAFRKAAGLGYMTIIDLSAAETAFQAARSSILTIEQQQEQERLALNESLGLPPEQTVLLQKGIEPPAAQTLPTAAKIMEGIETRRLDLLALKKGYQSQEARVRSAILAQFPKVNIGFSQARDTGNVISTGFGVTIGLPVFDRNQGQIAIERATRKQLFDEYVSRLFKARSDVGQALANMESTRKEIDADEQAIPALESLVRNYHTALLQGNADVISYYTARNQLFEKQIETLKLKQELADLYNAFEIAAGWYGPIESQEAPE